MKKWMMLVAWFLAGLLCVALATNAVAGDPTPVRNIVNFDRDLDKVQTYCWHVDGPPETNFHQTKWWATITDQLGVEADPEDMWVATVTVKLYTRYTSETLWTHLKSYTFAAHTGQGDDEWTVQVVLSNQPGEHYCPYTDPPGYPSGTRQFYPAIGQVARTVSTIKVFPGIEDSREDDSEDARLERSPLRKFALPLQITGPDFPLISQCGLKPTPTATPTPTPSPFDIPQKVADDTWGSAWVDMDSFEDIIDE